MYSDNKALQGKNAELQTKVDGYTKLIETSIKDEKFKTEVADDIINGNIFIDSKFKNIKAKFDALLIESLGDACDCDTGVIMTDPNAPCTVTTSPAVIAKKKENIGKVSDLIGDAWCTLDTKKEGCQ